MQKRRNVCRGHYFNRDDESSREYYIINCIAMIDEDKGNYYVCILREKMMMKEGGIRINLMLLIYSVE